MSDSSGRDVAPDALAADVAVRYRERLILFAARRLKNRAAAEDAAQETLRRVLDALRQGRVRDLQALPAFTFETARHVCQHMLRDQYATDRAHTALEQQPALVMGEHPDPLSLLVTAERVAQVRETLESLEPTDRVLLQLSFVEGLPTREIADRLGLTPVNVRVRRHRLLRRLGVLVTDSRHEGPEE